jgi:hypothetical protein
VCSLQDSGLARWWSYPLAPGCRAPRRIMAAPARPIFFFAKLGGGSLSGVAAASGDGADVSLPHLPHRGNEKGPRQNLLAEPHRQTHPSIATESTQYLPRLAVPGAAVKGHELTCAPQQTQSYSITSSAMVSSDGGTVRPVALAVFRLTMSLYSVGACTGRSAGFSPLRMRST